MPGDEKLPPEGRVTRFNALLPIGVKCRWCDRPSVEDRRGNGLVMCILCDRPNVALDMAVPQ